MQSSTTYVVSIHYAWKQLALYGIPWPLGRIVVTEQGVEITALGFKIASIRPDEADVLYADGMWKTGFRFEWRSSRPTHFTVWCRRPNTLQDALEHCGFRVHAFW